MLSLFFTMSPTFFLFLADAQQPQGTNAWFFLQLIALGVIFYFLLIRPQKKRQKDHATLVASAKAGDKVVMNSGIHGIVVNVKETTVQVRVADNVKIEFDKAAIAAIVKED